MTPTPGPWKNDGTDIFDPDGNIVAVTWAKGRSVSKAVEDAKHIVRCVNGWENVAQIQGSQTSRPGPSPGARMSPLQLWAPAKDGDSSAYMMARRHYSAWKNRTPKQRQFVGPGEPIVLVGFMLPALFVWRKSRYRQDGQTGVECSLFRNESRELSSRLIVEAMAWAWDKWPGERLFTMVDPKRIKSTNPGYCFLMAGWRRCGTSGRGLLILEKGPPV